MKKTPLPPTITPPKHDKTYTPPQVADKGSATEVTKVSTQGTEAETRDDAIVWTDL